MTEQTVQFDLASLGVLEDAVFFGPAGLAVQVTGLCVDSRHVKAGDLFAALPGSAVHGAEFIPYALRMGAVAVLTDADGFAWVIENGLSDRSSYIVSEDPRRGLAHAAARFYGKQPSVITAITGTNGKTSIATFTRQIWQTLGHSAVNFGTAGVQGAVTRNLLHTTPEPITLHALLADLVQSGVTHAAMEASSHGLEQRRLDGVHLAAAGFTHLTRDHLDYHATEAEYAAAKLGLFTRILPQGGVAVTNLDDATAARVVEISADRGQSLITVGRHAAALLRLLDVTFTPHGQYIAFSWKGARFEAQLALVGSFQAENALMAAALVIAAGDQPEAVFATLRDLTTVRGRMELAARRKNGAAIYVDYSHTPDSLATALQALRPHVEGRLIVVFGAGGDRDKGKRPLMGQAACTYADVQIVTDDNPRTETASAIRREVLAGCPDATEIGDRAEAILSGVDALQPDDILLIAGKGHETGQIIGQEIYPFDDVEQARAAVAALDGGA